MRVRSKSIIRDSGETFSIIAQNILAEFQPLMEASYCALRKDVELLLPVDVGDLRCVLHY